jgi:hypothetical protein
VEKVELRSHPPGRLRGNDIGDRLDQDPVLLQEREALIQILRREDVSYRLVEILDRVEAVEQGKDTALEFAEGVALDLQGKALRNDVEGLFPLLVRGVNPKGVVAW